MHYVDYSGIKRSDGPVGILCDDKEPVVFAGVEYSPTPDRRKNPEVCEVLDRCGIRLLSEDTETAFPWYPAPGLMVIATDGAGGFYASPLSGELEQVYFISPRGGVLFLAESLRELLSFLVFEPERPVLPEELTLRWPDTEGARLLADALPLERSRTRFAERLRPAPEFQLFDTPAQAKKSLPFLDMSDFSWPEEESCPGCGAAGQISRKE